MSKSGSRPLTIGENFMAGASAAACFARSLATVPPFWMVSVPPLTFVSPL